MDKDKNPYLFFGIYTVIIQAVMWAMFSLLDYGIDEGHWAALSDLENNDFFMFLIAPIPIVSYLMLNKKYFSNGNPIRETLFQLICWFMISILMSAPIHLCISHGTWIVEQKGLNTMNGLEYVLVNIYELILTALLMVKLIVHTVIHFQKKAT